MAMRFGSNSCFCTRPRKPTQAEAKPELPALERTYRDAPSKAANYLIPLPNSKTNGWIYAFLALFGNFKRSNFDPINSAYSAPLTNAMPARGRQMPTNLCLADMIFVRLWNRCSRSWGKLRPGIIQAGRNNVIQGVTDCGRFSWQALTEVASGLQRGERRN